MTLRNLDRWVRGMRDGMAGCKKPQAAEVGRPSAGGAGPRRPFFLGEPSVEIEATLSWLPGDKRCAVARTAD